MPTAAPALSPCPEIGARAGVAVEGRSAEDGVDVEERFATPATELELDVASARDVDDGVTEAAEGSVGIELEVWDGSATPPLEVVEG